MKKLFLLLALLYSFASFARTPAKVYLPKNLMVKAKWPLVISLHGFLSGPSLQNKIFSADKFVDSKGFILVAPFGLRNRIGIRYWNASDVCCDIFDQNPDDITYLKQLITEVKKNYPVDPDKVFLVGHSNGGFLAYRFACEAAELISGIVSISGSNSLGAIKCHPARPVSILQIHGTKDRIIKYEGNPKRDLLSAQDSIIPWASFNGCQVKVNFKMGDEIGVTGFDQCQEKKSVSLWTLKGHRHNERLGDDLTSKILDYLSL